MYITTVSKLLQIFFRLRTDILMVLRYVLPSCEKVFQFFLITRKNKLTKNFIDSVNQDGQAPFI